MAGRASSKSINTANTKQLQGLKKNTLDVVTYANKATVANAVQYEKAVNYLSAINDLKKQVVAYYKDAKQKAHEAHQAVIKLEKDQLQPLDAAFKAISAAALPWKQEQDRKAREAEIEAQKQRQAALDRERELSISSAQLFGVQGAAEPAQLVARRSAVEPDLPKAAGISTRRKWCFRIVDPSKVKQEYLAPNLELIQVRINSITNLWPNKGFSATPEQIASLQELIGGVEVYVDENFTGTRKS